MCWRLLRWILSLSLFVLLTAARGESIEVLARAEERPAGMPLQRDKDRARQAAYRRGLEQIRQDVAPEVPEAVYRARINRLSPQQVSDSILSEKILREPQRRGYYQIELLVTFDGDRVRSWFEQGAPGQTARVQGARVMVVIGETHGGRRVVDGVGEPEIIGALLDNGYSVVDKARVAGIRDREELVTRALDGEPGPLLATGREFGAEFLVYGHASCEEVPGGGNLSENIRTCRARVEARILTSETMRLLYSGVKEAGAYDVSGDAAGRKAIRSAAKELGRELVQTLTEKAANRQVFTSVAVQLRDASAEQKDHFLRAVQQLGEPGGATVDSFLGGIARIEVKTERPASEVEPRLRKLLEKLPFAVELEEQTAQRLVYAVKHDGTAAQPPAPYVPHVAQHPRPPYAVAPAEGVDVSGQRWKALLIGINDYSRTPFQNLMTPRRDVEALETVLRERYGFAEVRMIRDGEADFRGVRKALADLAETSTQDDNILVYYAGHGTIQPSGMGVWITADARDEYDGVANAEIKEIISNMRARRVLLVSDSCYSGDFLSRAVGRITQETLVTEPQAALLISSALAANSMTAREVITSGNLNPVPDEARGACAGHSPFACTLLQALESVPPGGVIGTTDLYGQIWLGMREGVSEGQGPQRGQLPEHKGGEFFLVRR